MIVEFLVLKFIRMQLFRLQLVSDVLGDVIRLIHGVAHLQLIMKAFFLEVIWLEL